MARASIKPVTADCLLVDGAALRLKAARLVAERRRESGPGPVEFERIEQQIKGDWYDKALTGPTFVAAITGAAVDDLGVALC
jgi:hypothetical protein